MSALIVNTNIAGLNSHRNMKRVSDGSFKRASRLSSGLRINSAADDAAGLAISRKMMAQIRGLRQAERNVDDGISLTRTMDGGMEGIQEMMIRMRELLIQALNDTNTPEDRQKIQLELDQLTDEIDATADRVEFNTIKLLNIPSEGFTVSGTAIEVVMQPAEAFPTPDKLPNATVEGAAGWGYIYLPEGATITIKVTVQPGEISGDWPDLVIWAPNGDKFGFGQGGFLTGGSPATTTSASSAESVYYTGYGNIMTSSNGYTQPGEEYFTITNVSAAGAGNWMVGMSNAGGTKEMTFTLSIENPNMPGLELVQHGTGDVFVPNERWIQAGANSMQHILVNRYDCRAVALGISALSTASVDAMNASLISLDAAFDRINTFRSTVGAQQNRMEYTSKSLGISSQNLDASRARIEDADMAKEMMELVKNQVLMQAAASMLSQANSSSQDALHLLR